MSQAHLFPWENCGSSPHGRCFEANEGQEGD